MKMQKLCHYPDFSYRYFSVSIFCKVGISGYIGAILLGGANLVAQVSAFFISDTVSFYVMWNTCTGTHMCTHAMHALILKQSIIYDCL